MVTSIRSLPDEVELEGGPAVPTMGTEVEGAFMGCETHDMFEGTLLQAFSFALSLCLSREKNPVSVGAVESWDQTIASTLVDSTP
jgi:hypothetical protein